MSHKPILQAGLNHPITIEPSGHRVTVTRAGRTVAESEDSSLVIDGDTSTNSVWQYREPHPGMEAITGHVAFYPDRVTINEG